MAEEVTQCAAIIHIVQGQLGACATNRQIVTRPTKRRSKSFTEVVDESTVAYHETWEAARRLVRPLDDSDVQRVIHKIRHDSDRLDSDRMQNFWVDQAPKAQITDETRREQLIAWLQARKQRRLK
eukprot:c7006_g1_i2.p1 GENE.c7006_g1_i2~~c7006_g1_i2.p1  ORF type:complete len:125 (+),score=24.10 c7006_g1_i2:143-517(+)